MICFVFLLVVTPPVAMPPLRPSLANPPPCPTTHPPSSMRSFPRNPSNPQSPRPPNRPSLSPLSLPNRQPRNRNPNPQLLHHLKGLAVLLSTPLNHWQTPRPGHLTNPTLPLVEIPPTLPPPPPLHTNPPPICRRQHLQSRLLTLQVSVKSCFLLLVHLGMWFGEDCYRLAHRDVLWRC